MSVHRLLIDNQFHTSPSMEAAQLEQGIQELHSQAVFLLGSLQQAANDSLSMESSCVLQALGYSTEAEEKKGLIGRIWEGIKKIFGKIKEFVSRLISIRKQYLKNNELKIDKIRKYVNAIPADRKPSAKIRPSTTLLPREPGKALSAVTSFRDQGKHVMDYRSKSLETLVGMDVKQLANKHVEDFTSSLYGQGSRVEHGRRAAVFIQRQGELAYKEDGSFSDTSVSEVDAPSVMTMHSLIIQYERLLEDDGKFLREIEKGQVDTDNFVNKLEHLKDDNDYAKKMMESDEARSQASHIWHEAALMIRVVNSVSRLTHTHVWSSLLDDIQTILQQSLGAYKFHEKEVKDEDRTDKKKDKDGDHEYR